MQVYLQDGRVEIDNNLVENAIRPTAVGKKNWLFIGEAGAGDRSAIDPFTYLRDVLSRLPNMTNHQIPEVAPQAWFKSQRPVQLQRDYILDKRNPRMSGKAIFVCLHALELFAFGKDLVPRLDVRCTGDMTAL